MILAVSSIINNIIKPDFPNGFFPSTQEDKENFYSIEDFLNPKTFFRGFTLECLSSNENIYKSENGMLIQFLFIKDKGYLRIQKQETLLQLGNWYASEMFHMSKLTDKEYRDIIFRLHAEEI